MTNWDSLSAHVKLFLASINDSWKVLILPLATWWYQKPNEHSGLTTVQGQNDSVISVRTVGINYLHNWTGSLLITRILVSLKLLTKLLENTILNPAIGPSVVVNVLVSWSVCIKFSNVDFQHLILWKRFVDRFAVQSTNFPAAMVFHQFTLFFAKNSKMFQESKWMAKLEWKCSKNGNVRRMDTTYDRSLSALINGCSAIKESNFSTSNFLINHTLVPQYHESLVNEPHVEFPLHETINSDAGCRD